MGNMLLDSIRKKYSVYHSYSAWSQWVISHQENHSSLSQVVENKLNSTLIGEMKVIKDLNNLENSLKISQFRSNFIGSCVVGVYGIYSSCVGNPTQQSFCGVIEQYIMVTERMVYCFSDLGQISFKKAIFILKSALKGAKLIFDHLSILTLYDENMIFFDKNNNCKVWINQDANSNFSRYQELSVNQSDCIDSIFTVIEQKIEHSQQFQEFLRLKHSITIEIFDEALNFLNRFDYGQDLVKTAFEDKKLLIQKNEPIPPLRNKDNKNSSKKSLSVKKVKKQPEPCIFFSAKKPKLDNLTENQLAPRFTKQIANTPSTFKINFPDTKISKNLFMNAHKKNNFPDFQAKKEIHFDAEKKCTDLKKRNLNKDLIKQKFLDSRSKQEKNLKPSSTLSTQYDSQEVQSYNQSRVESQNTQNLKELNFKKKILHNKNLFKCKKGGSRLPNNPKNQQICDFRHTSINQLDSFYSDRKIFNEDIEKSSKNYLSDQNIPHQKTNNNKFSIADRSSKLSKNPSMPLISNFQRINPLLSV